MCLIQQSLLGGVCTKEGELDQIITAGSVFQSFYFNLLKSRFMKTKHQCIAETYTQVPVKDERKQQANP